MLGFPNFDPKIWTWEDHIRDNVDKQIRHGYSELLDHMPSALLVGRFRTPTHPSETRLSLWFTCASQMEEQSRNSHPVGRQSQREKPEMDSVLNVDPLSNCSSQSHTSPQERSEWVTKIRSIAFEMFPWVRVVEPHSTSTPHLASYRNVRSENWGPF